ncbi:MJ0936 family phosphodiesterase [Enterococcus phoeniculicola]|jgi:putative phosphoesterase|uniref:Phosphoesterase n=1 Tax=Enterococcus phoeniculicola ATCC BAA-412 TaxID=1158610 RepID=R3WF81_9ENTE|nr:metallophosphoesterase [Enterococcus phoeniculicola]EOL46122.1 MJ0936 family phosphodiesterase [Enterococcus phoeniculicola ATCC BAA-412]EOT77033.1 phosphodiesterase [Enterococcus phoeniculicola ATCC BAA-412]OJG73372.1 MJ0936 family phosphodiesterase [Enterococcus phoeniculicola]
MKYLVVSDNHGDRQILLDLVERYKEKMDYFFHCGDSELDSHDKLWDTFIVVRGNCDYGGDFLERQTISTQQDIVYITHGHLSNVRFGLTQLSIEAKESNATISLFGHTHQIGCEVVDEILYLNPGSISQPRGPIQIPSYAVIDSTPDAFDVQYYNRAHHPVEELHFSFPKLTRE